MAFSETTRMFRDRVFKRMRTVARSECVLSMGQVSLCSSSLCYEFMLQ